jgi:hypothetical protein
VAARGLASIRVREEGERLALWGAWMNLEAGLGAGGQLGGVFARACASGGCDPRALHFTMLGILERAASGSGASELRANACSCIVVSAPAMAPTANSPATLNLPVMESASAI